MSSNKLLVLGGAALALLAINTAFSVQTLPPVPDPKGLPDPGSIVSLPDPGSVPVPRHPPIQVPEVPDPGDVPPPPDPQVPSVSVPEVQPGNPPYHLPNPSNSYRVMCEQGGLAFELKGGLLYLDPETLLISSISTPDLALLNLVPRRVPGPVTIDIPDRYQAANCSNDGGRTWGHVLLDFYVPNLGESSGVNTGLESTVFGDDGEGQPVDDEQADDFSTFVAALQDLLADPSSLPGEDPAVGPVEGPALPSVPSPLYTIDVKYRGPLGQYYTTTVPGVIGVPTRVSLVNYYGNTPEVLLVSIGPSQTLSGDGTVSSSGYALSVDRQTPNVPDVVQGVSELLPCQPLEADVKVTVHVANPQAPGYPDNATGNIELGYATIPTGKAPSTFTLKYEGSTASVGPTRSDFFVDVAPNPGCSGPGPMTIVGKFQDSFDPAVATDDVDLALDLQMPVMTHWTLARKTAASGKLLITSQSAQPLGRLSISGVNKGKDLVASLSSVPQALTVCSHKGNQCNQPWRLDRASEVSFYITARDGNGNAKPLTARYFEANAAEHIDLSLTLSDIAYDSKSGKIHWTDAFPLGSTDEYPMWFYFDTGGRYLGGYYHSGADGHRLDIDIPGSHTRAWNREIVLSKKWWESARVSFWGYMECSSGFSIKTDMIGGTLGGLLLGAALCSAFVP